ncbi:MAG: type II toxin-antitoxin system VapC family toxin [Candidatus Brocadiaceae bacterium]|nr:type II toxin-antitoxin system VapC family toxin [Candidatus Brocadiaceae bacterium]
MKQKIYIETTIPSFYYEVRTEPEMIAMREWTQDWWNNQQHHYDLVTSIPVIEELENGDHPSKQATLELISNLPILPIHEEIEEIVEEYVSHYIMPNDPKGDALHLALASYHHCHFLLTWNCAHIANANKFEHIRHINTMLGLYVPILTTPFELLYWEEK